jgi:hypothetical protein
VNSSSLDAGISVNCFSWVRRKFSEFLRFLLQEAVQGLDPDLLLCPGRGFFAQNWFCNDVRFSDSFFGLILNDDLRWIWHKMAGLLSFVVILHQLNFRVPNPFQRLDLDICPAHLMCFLHDAARRGFRTSKYHVV